MPVWYGRWTWVSSICFNKNRELILKYKWFLKQHFVSHGAKAFVGRGKNHDGNLYALDGLIFCCQFGNTLGTHTNRRKRKQSPRRNSIRRHVGSIILTCGSCTGTTGLTCMNGKDWSHFRSLISDLRTKGLKWRDILIWQWLDFFSTPKGYWISRR